MPHPKKERGRPSESPPPHRNDASPEKKAMRSSSSQLVESRGARSIGAESMGQ